MEKVSYRKGKHQYGCREALTSIGFAGLPPKKNTVTHIYVCLTGFRMCIFYVRHVTNAPVKCNSLARLVPMVRANFWLKPQAGAIPGRYVLEWFSTQDASGTWRLDKVADTSSKKLRAENGTWKFQTWKVSFSGSMWVFRSMTCPKIVKMIVVTGTLEHPTTKNARLNGNLIGHKAIWVGLYNSERRFPS